MVFSVNMIGNILGDDMNTCQMKGEISRIGQMLFEL